MTGLRPYIPPGEMPAGSRSIFHNLYIPEGWIVLEFVVKDSLGWFVCEKMMMTGEMK